MYRVLDTLDAVQKQITQIPAMDLPSGILMVKPTYFKVVDIKNPYMKNNIGKVSLKKATKEWDTLYHTFEALLQRGFIRKLEFTEGKKGLEDMVFCANPAFYWLDANQEQIVLLSHMKYENRQKEVAFFESFFHEKNIKTVRLDSKIHIEGNGDLIAHPGKRLIWMGHGFRTDLIAAHQVAAILDAYVIPLRLVSEDFYHLDTCFTIIDEEHVAICSEAFDKHSLQLIQSAFKFTYEVPLKESKNGFALNSLVLYKNKEAKIALIPQGNPQLKKWLSELHLEVIELDTKEFIKSGGSIYCMKMLTYDS